MTRPPKKVRRGSASSRYRAQRITPAPTDRVTELPKLFLASPIFPAPMRMLTQAQHPSPIMTAIASATTVRGNTTVLAAFPPDPR